MASQPDYFPTRLSLVGPWGDNLETAAQTYAWDLTWTVEYGALAAAVTAFNAAYLASSTPASRTPVTVATTQTALATLSAAARTFVGLVQASPATTNAQRADAGITVPGAGGAPATIPPTPPNLEFRSSQPGDITLNMLNVELPDSRALPAGASAWELWAHVGATPVTDPALASFRTAYARPLQLVPVPAGDVGQVVTYFARYINPSATTGSKIGVWSPPLSVTAQ